MSADIGETLQGDRRPTSTHTHPSTKPSIWQTVSPQGMPAQCEVVSSATAVRVGTHIGSKIRELQLRQGPHDRPGEQIRYKKSTPKFHKSFSDLSQIDRRQDFNPNKSRAVYNSSNNLLQDNDLTMYKGPFDDEFEFDNDFDFNQLLQAHIKTEQNVARSRHSSEKVQVDRLSASTPSSPVVRTRIRHKSEGNHLNQGTESQELEDLSSPISFKETRQLVFLEPPSPLPVPTINVENVESMLPSITLEDTTEGVTSRVSSGHVEYQTVPPSTTLDTKTMTPTIIVDTKSEPPTITVESSQHHVFPQAIDENKQLHSETIRIRTNSDADRTLELTLTLSERSTEIPDSPNLSSPTQKRRFMFRQKPQASRRSFMLPSFLRLMSGEKKTTEEGGPRRNSEPFTGMLKKQDEELVILKLEAVAVNAAYLLSRAQAFSGTMTELAELEDEIERTERALGDVELVAPQVMATHVARASRALQACKHALEERSPTIDTLDSEVDFRRRSSSVSGGDVRNVAMRVMALNKQVEQRRASQDIGR